MIWNKSSPKQPSSSTLDIPHYCDSSWVIIFSASCLSETSLHGKGRKEGTVLTPDPNGWTDLVAIVSKTKSLQQDVIPSTFCYVMYRRGRRSEGFDTLTSPLPCFSGASWPYFLLLECRNTPGANVSIFLWIEDSAVAHDTPFLLQCGGLFWGQRYVSPRGNPKGRVVLIHPSHDPHSFWGCIQRTTLLFKACIQPK